MATKILCAALALVLVACGGGSNDAPPGPKPTSLVVIGNSLAFVPDQPGWSPGRGMAATSVATDYVHVLAAELGIAQPVARNFASLERNADDPVNAIDLTTPIADQIKVQTTGIDVATAVVVELGDNSPSGQSATFATNYGLLLDALPAHHSLTCVSTWWEDAAKDATIKAACKAHGGTFVFIGDIYPARKDVAAPGENPAIWAHPHDPSMASIAARIKPAIF